MLLLRPEFISSPVFFQALKDMKIINAEAYVISPADLDFKGYIKTVDSKKLIYSFADDLRSRINKIPVGSHVVIDGVMLHDKLTIPSTLITVYIDTLGLNPEYFKRFKEVKRLSLKVPETLYKTVLVNTAQDKNSVLSDYLVVNKDLKHVVYGVDNISIKGSGYHSLRERIKEFNATTSGVLYLNEAPNNEITNVDYLHIMKPLYAWDYEYLASMIFKSIYTNRDLRVIFYVAPNETDKFQQLMSHLNEHLSFEDNNLQHVAPISVK